MRLSIHQFWNQQKERKPPNDLNLNVIQNVKKDQQLWRDIVAYWILGLCTEFGYVVIISASHDILHRFQVPKNDEYLIEKSSPAVYDPSSNYRNICETQSTGVLLVADIGPSVLVNILCPFLPLAKNYRMLSVVALNITSFLLISNTDQEYLAIIGVVFTSLALGISEVTLLSYSARFNKKVIAAWSSGTGSSGIIGSTSWAALTAFGFDPRDKLRLMLIVPPIQAAAFWLLLRSPTNSTGQSGNVDISTIESAICQPNCVSPNIEIKSSGFKAKLKCLPSLVTFICPLVLVFIFEYICVSGLFEMIYIRSTWLEHESQYHWFLVVYQIGVFSSRSIGSLIAPKHTFWAPIVQFLNVCFFMYEASVSQTTEPTLIFIIVFCVGAVGGLCYIHTLQRLIIKLPKNQHKFSLGMVTMAESFGIAIGGFSAIPIHNLLCRRFIV